MISMQTMRPRGPQVFAIALHVPSQINNSAFDRGCGAGRRGAEGDGVHPMRAAMDGVSYLGDSRDKYRDRTWVAGYDEHFDKCSREGVVIEFIQKIEGRALQCRESRG